MSEPLLSGLELAVAKVSRVRGPRWLLWRLTNALRPAIGRVVIETNRVAIKRAATCQEQEWCALVLSTLQAFLGSIDSLVRQGDEQLPAAPLPRKITHRARKRAQLADVGQERGR
jgi:hypothetical protein